MTKRVFIVHGYESSPKEHWFDWLGLQTKSLGTEVTAINMPNSSNPTVNSWQLTLDQYIGLPNENVFLIGHSLGCITLLNFLCRHQPKKIGGIILAAGFYENLPELPQLDEYITNSKINFTLLKKIHMTKMCFISANDYLVPYQSSLNLANSLNSPFEIINDGGHLMACDGFEQFPQIWQHLKIILSQNTI